MTMVIPSVTLNNGVVMPQLGLGVFRTTEGVAVDQAVGAAFEAGYRLIDTAAAYQNEVGVGAAIRASGLPRDELFITTKLWNADHAYDDALRAFDASLQRLNCTYIDLYLIHFPVPGYGMFTQAWKALETLYHRKLVRAIGVSNFMPHHLDVLLNAAEIIPAVNQIELHPLFQQHNTRRYCTERGMTIESYSPLMEGKVVTNPVIVELAEYYMKTPAQIVLRWHIQHGVIVIPKSVRPARIQENIAVFDFELSQQDMQRIDALERGERVGVDPDTFNVR